MHDRRSDPALKKGGWLHLDVSFGCAGDMLTAALLDLGAPEAALREGLLQAGLVGVGPRLREDRRGPARGLHLTYVDQRGRPLQVPGEPPPLRLRRVAAEGRRKGPAPHRETRRPKEALAAARAEGAPGAFDEEGTAQGAEVFAGPGAGGPPVADVHREGADDDEGAGPGRVSRWLEDHPVTAQELTDFLAESRLPPIPRALARKALRRLIEGWQAFEGRPPPELSLPGRAGLDALCDVVGVAVLVAFIEPAMITSSAVAISTAPHEEEGTLVPGPSGWVLACSEGLKVQERDFAYECTTPTGAALVWALAHRTGPRGLVVETARGTGLGTHDVREQANLCRALYAEAPVVEAREGTEPRPARVSQVSAVLPGAFDRPRLLAELRRAGASSLWTAPVTEEGGAVAAALSLVVGQEVLDEVRRLLFVHGAREITLIDAERHAPAVREVTVPVGSGKKRQAVRVTEIAFSGALLRAEPRAEDVLEAASLLATGPAEVRADALAAWRRLTHAGDPALGGSAGAGGEEEPREG